MVIMWYHKEVSHCQIVKTVDESSFFNLVIQYVSLRARLRLQTPTVPVFHLFVSPHNQNFGALGMGFI